MDLYKSIVAFYDCEHDGFTADIDFYLNLITSGPVLEIGVGSGRIAGALAGAGLEIWGIDASPSMLDVARRRVGESPRVQLFEMRAQDLDLPARFPFVLASLNTLWHVTEQKDRLELLRRIRLHLQPPGILVVDLTNPLAMAGRGGNGEVRRRFEGECLGGWLCISEAAWDDEAEQSLQISLTYDLCSPDGKMTRSHSTRDFRYLYRSELELLLSMAGFNVAQVYGSYDLEPYCTDSPNLIAVATPDSSYPD